MDAVRFETTILDNGMIQISNFQKMKSKKVEVVILYKPENE